MLKLLILTFLLINLYAKDNLIEYQTTLYKQSLTQTKNSNIIKLSYIYENHNLKNSYTIFHTNIKDIYFFHEQFLIKSYTDKYKELCIETFNKANIKSLMQKYCLEYGEKIEEQENMLNLLTSNYNSKALFYNGGIDTNDFFGVSFYKGKFYLHDLDRGNKQTKDEELNQPYLVKNIIKDDWLDIKYSTNNDIKNKLENSIKFNIEENRQTPKRKEFWDDKDTKYAILFSELAYKNIFEKLFEENLKFVALKLYKDRFFKETFSISHLEIDNEIEYKKIKTFLETEKNKLSSIQLYNIYMSLYLSKVELDNKNELLKSTKKYLKDYINYKNSDIYPLIYRMFDYKLIENDTKLVLEDKEEYSYNEINDILENVEQNCNNAKKAYYTKFPLLKKWADDVSKKNCNLLYYMYNEE